MGNLDWARTAIRFIKVMWHLVVPPLASVCTACALRVRVRVRVHVRVRVRIDFFGVVVDT